MFEHSAELYDAFYEALGKDYPAEAHAVRELIGARAPGASTLLDVACGTGRHLEFLSTSLDCYGVDLDPQLLDIAVRRCPNVTFAAGDMRSLNVGRTFDVIICLFSSIGYVENIEGLNAAISSMATHLGPRGLLIVEPWFDPESWTAGRVQVVDAQVEGCRAVRMMLSATEGTTSVLHTHYLISRESAIEHAVEQHILGLFSREQYTNAFTSVGLTVEWDTDGLTGRGLILGSAPAP